VNSTICTALSSRTQRLYSVSTAILLRVSTMSETHCLKSSSVRFLQEPFASGSNFSKVSRTAQRLAGVTGRAKHTPLSRPGSARRRPGAPHSEGR